MVVEMVEIAKKIEYRLSQLPSHQREELIGFVQGDVVQQELQRQLNHENKFTSRPPRETIAETVDHAIAALCEESELYLDIGRHDYFPNLSPEQVAYIQTNAVFLRDLFIG